MEHQVDKALLVIVYGYYIVISGQDFQVGALCGSDVLLLLFQEEGTGRSTELRQQLFLWYIRISAAFQHVNLVCVIPFFINTTNHTVVVCILSACHVWETANLNWLRRLTLSSSIAELVS